MEKAQRQVRDFHKKVLDAPTSPAEPMIRRGHLVNVDARRIVVPDLDLGRVARRGGDFTEGSLGHALGDSAAGRNAWRHVLQLNPLDIRARTALEDTRP